MLVLIIYLISLLKGLEAVSVIGSFFFFMGAFVFWTYSENGRDEGETIRYKKIGKTFLKGFIVSLTVGVFVPSEDTAYKMLAAYGVTEAYSVASESEDVQRMAGKSLAVLEKFLDEQLSNEQPENVTPVKEGE